MDIQQATLLETLTLYADKTQQQRDIVVTDRMSFYTLKTTSGNAWNSACKSVVIVSLI